MEKKGEMKTGEVSVGSSWRYKSGGRGCAIIGNVSINRYYLPRMAARACTFGGIRPYCSHHMRAEKYKYKAIG